MDATLEFQGNMRDEQSQELDAGAELMVTTEARGRTGWYPYDAIYPRPGEKTCGFTALSPPAVGYRAAGTGDTAAGGGGERNRTLIRRLLRTRATVALACYRKSEKGQS